MKTPTMKLQIANTTVETPIYGDEKRTRRLAELVNERIAEIETQSPRIDTQAFALQAALAFAAQALDQAEKARAETAEMAAGLSAVADRLREMLAEFPSI